MSTQFIGVRGMSALLESLFRKKADRGFRSTLKRSRSSLQSQVRLFETLESRFTFSVGGISPQNWLGTPYNYSTNAMGLPLLESLPGAAGDIFLDFDGHSGGQHGHPAYDSDGNPASFSATEQADIFKQWKYVANALAPFNINVTTVYHSSLPKGWLTFFPGAAGGSAAQGSFGINSGPTGSVASGNVTNYNSPSTALHEIGHMLNLSHLSTYDINGNQLDEYASKVDNNHGVLMGKDWEGYFQKFIYGRPSSSSFRDDVAVVIAEIESELGAGNALRIDDFANSHSSTNVSLDSTTYPGYFVKSGVIETISDIDSFKLASTGGRYSIYVGADYGSMLDARIRIRNSSGTLIYEVNSSQNQVPIDIDLPSGNIYVQVCSAENYSDIGTYNLVVTKSISAANSFWANSDIGGPGGAGFSSYEPTSGTFTVAGSGSQIGSSEDEFQFAYQKLTGDGTIETRIVGLDPTSSTAKGGIMMRSDLTGGSKNVALVMMSQGGGKMQARTSTDGGSSTAASFGSGAFAAQYLKLERIGNSIKGYIKTNVGDAWTLLGTQSLSLGSTIYVGIATSSYDDRFTNFAQYQNVVVTATGTGSLSNANPATLPLNALTAPTIGAISNVTGTGMTVSWSNVSGESGYTIERSDGKGGFITAGTVAANILTFADTGLSSGLRYTYRVRANGDSNTTVSAASGLVLKNTWASPATNLIVSSISTSKLAISWTDGYFEESFRLERSTNSSFTAGTVTTFTLPPNITGYIDTGLTIDTEYFYRVVTVDEGFDNATSAVASNVTKMGAVATLTGTVTSYTATLTWSDVANETAFRVQELIDNGNGDKEWQIVTDLPANTLTHTISNLGNFTKYTFRVVPLRGTTEGASKIVYLVTDTSPYTPLPHTWTATQIGSPVFPGKWKSTYTGGTTEFRTYVASGDIAGTADNFTFANVSIPVANITITAQVTYINYSVTGAKAGIMIRQNNTAGSANVFLSLEEQTGGANDVLFRRRSSAGGSTSTIDRDTGFNTPFWVRMVLSGAGATKTVTAYRSPDGITWTAMSSTTTISLTGNMTVGLAFSSNDPGAGEPVTARFKNVLITGGANIAPFARSQDFDSEDGLTQGVAFNGNAITDDYDPNGNSLTATKLTNPANGTITFNSDGTFIYTSNAGFVGTDSFTYRVSDGSTNSNTATISFIVTGSGSMMMAGSSSSGGSTSSTLSRSSLVGMSSNPNAQIAALTPGKSYFLSLGADAEENQVAKTNQRGDSFPANSAEHASSKSTDSKIRQMFATLFDDTENKLFGTSFLARKKFGTRT